MFTQSRWSRFKKLLLLPIVVALAIPFSFFVPTYPVSAVTTSSDSSSSQTDLWYSFTAMEYCLRYSPIETDSGKVAAGQLFYDGGKPNVLAISFSGKLSGDYPNSELTCGADSSYISTNALKSFGVTNSLDFVCNTLGYTRNQNQSCTKGGNQFNSYGGRTPNDLADAWRKEYKGQIAVGGTGDLPTDKSSVAYVYYKGIYVNACTTTKAWPSAQDGSNLKISSLDTSGNSTTEYYVQSSSKASGDSVNVSVYTNNGLSDSGGKKPITLTCDQLKNRVNDNFPAYKSAQTRYNGRVFCESSPQSFTGSVLAACINGAVNKSNVTYCADNYAVAAELSACGVGHSATIQNIPSPSGSPGNAKSSCAIENIGWIVCPVVNFLAGMADGAFGFLANNFLQTNTSLVDTSDKNGTYVAWSYMRTFANVAFVIVFLIIIFSQLVGVGVSNYGVKKLLPRMVVAVILVNISFFISQLAVDVSNILGFSIKNVFDSISTSINTSSIQTALQASNSPIGNSTTGQGFSGVVGTVLVIGTATAAGYALISTVIPVLLAAVIALLMILFILVARQAIIVLLIVVSPLAFVAFLLPNTENLFKQWRKMLTVMLLLFPIIALVFGASTLASHILGSAFNDNNGISGDTNNMFGQIIAAAILVVPLFAVPLILKKALDGIPALGQMTSKFAGRANGNVGKRINESYKNSLAGVGRSNRLRARDEFFRKKTAKRISGGGFTGVAAGIAAGGLSNLGITAKQRAQRDAVRNNARAVVAGSESEELKQASLALENELAKIAPEDRDKHLVGIATNSSKSEIERSSAMHKLAAGGRDDAIRKLTTHPSMSSESNQVALRRAIDSNAGSLIGKAPDLIKGADAAFRDVSGAELASFSRGTMQQYMGHMEELRTSTDPADAAKYAGAVNGFNAAVEDIKLNTTLQAAFKGEAGQAITAELMTKPDLATSIGTQAGFIGGDGKIRP
jgi:hypothetical protein